METLQQALDTNTSPARDLSFLAQGWRDVVGAQFDAPHFESLREFLRSEYKAGQQIFPPKEKIFRALSLVDYDEVKVVILGQDPYHGPKQANGLAFAVESGLATPPSLQNIFKEIANEYGKPPPKTTTLEGWAKQGVLLLNTVLTVRAGQAFSHHNRGWEIFTDAVISKLNERKQPIVFLLWGSPAQKKAALITGSHHLVLKAPHPSPLSAHRGFMGCNHFVKANEFLSRFGKTIDWFQI